MSWKRWVAGIGIAGVLVATYSMVFSGNEEAAAAKYRTARVERGDIVMSVTATGTLNAVQTVQVGSQVSGTIAQLYADYNDVVREGQVVAQIDPTFLQAQVTEAEANLERSRASVEEAKRNLERVKALLEQRYVSQAELDQREAAYRTATASQRQTEAALERARVNLKYATIRTPISGVVISRDVELGQTVAASLQAPTLFTIANDLTKMQLETNIDEADIGKIQEGQRVTFTVDAFPETEFEGRVAQIRLSPVTVQNVVTYTVIVDVPNPELKLRPGMTANVTIVVDQRFGVLRVPAVALRFRPAVQNRQGMGSAGTAAVQKEQGVWDKVAGWFRTEDKPDSAASPMMAFAARGAAMADSGRAAPGGAWTPSPEMLARMRERFGQDVPDSVLIARMRARMTERGGGMWGQGQSGSPTGQQSGGPAMMGSFQGAGQAMGSGMAQGMGRGGVRPTLLWTQDSGGGLKPVPVRTGISDGTYIEVMGDALMEGQEIIVAATSDNQATGGAARPGGMPFGMPMGGGARR
jgi:HlyD family secretion protein